MNPGAHPLEEEITNVGYLITCSRLPTPSQWKLEEVSRPTCDPQMQERLRVHAAYDTLSSVATMKIEGSAWTVSRPTLPAKESLAKQTQGTDPRTGELKRATNERRRATNSWT